MNLVLDLASAYFSSPNSARVSCWKHVGQTDHDHEFVLELCLQALSSPNDGYKLSYRGKKIRVKPPTPNINRWSYKLGAVSTRNDLLDCEPL